MKASPDPSQSAALEWVRFEHESLDCEHPRLEGQRVLFRDGEALRRWLQDSSLKEERQALLGWSEVGRLESSAAWPWNERLRRWLEEGLALPAQMDADELRLGLRSHAQLDARALGLRATLIGWPESPELPDGYRHTSPGRIEAHRPEMVRLWRERGVAHSNLPHTIDWHSPSGFEWGYSGSGPAELALNLLAAADPCPPEEQIQRWNLERQYGIESLREQLEQAEGQQEILALEGRLEAAYELLAAGAPSPGVQFRHAQGPRSNPDFYGGGLDPDPFTQGWVRERTARLYQSFKEEFISILPPEGGSFTLSKIRRWLETRQPQKVQTPRVLH